MGHYSVTGVTTEGTDRKALDNLVYRVAQEARDENGIYASVDTHCRVTSGVTVAEDFFRNHEEHRDSWAQQIFADEDLQEREFSLVIPLKDMDAARDYDASRKAVVEACFQQWGGAPPPLMAQEERAQLERIRGRSHALMDRLLQEMRGRGAQEFTSGYMVAAQKHLGRGLFLMALDSMSSSINGFFAEKENVRACHQEARTRKAPA